MQIPHLCPPFRHGGASYPEPLARPPVALSLEWHFHCPYRPEILSEFPDPIYAAIEAHKAACVRTTAAVSRQSVLEMNCMPTGGLRRRTVYRMNGCGGKR